MTEEKNELFRINEQLAFAINWKNRALDAYRGELTEIYILLCNVVERTEINKRRLINAKQAINAALKENAETLSTFEYLMRRAERAIENGEHYEKTAEADDD